jgi:antitoxin CcdA
MHPFIARGPKRPVNISLSENLVAQARNYTSNLSATLETLLAEYVVNRQQEQLSRQQMADACAADWNAVHEAVGSFADEHSTL